MIPARPIVITLLLAASAGSARGGDQSVTALQACIDNARQADATCSKLTDAPAQRLDCFERARNDQLACLQRALPDAPAKTTATEGDRGAQPREPAPKAATSDAPSQPAQPKGVQAKGAERPREDRRTQDSAQPTPQTGSQETAKKATDSRKSPASSVSNVAEPPASHTTADAPADTASITQKSPATAPIKNPTRTEAPTDSPAVTQNATPVPQPPAPTAAESAPPPRQADAVNQPKTPAPEPVNPPAKADTPADTPAVTANTTPAPQPPAPPAVESKPPPRQADAVGEPKTPAQEPIKPPAKADAHTDTPPVTANTTPAPQPPAAETAPPANQAGAVSEPKTQAKDSAKDSTKDSAKTSNAAAAKADTASAKQPAQSWVVSEMPSPIDYRPLLTAVLRPTSSSEGGPSSLTVRCLGGQTGLSIHTEGAWHAQRKNALPVDHQINDQSTVRQTWTLSSDAKSATYSGDPVALLRSLPEGARLTINVSDGANARHDATFLLAGWDTLRKRIGTACKWPKADAQASSGKQ